MSFDILARGLVSSAPRTRLFQVKSLNQFTSHLKPRVRNFAPLSEFKGSSLQYEKSKVMNGFRKTGFASSSIMGQRITSSPNTGVWGSQRFYSTGKNPQPVPVPPMGESISSGEIEEILKSKGDHVEADEIVAVIGTDKVNIEIRAPFAGEIVDLFAEEGDSVEVGFNLFTLIPAEKHASAAPAEAVPSAPPSETAAPQPAQPTQPTQPAKQPSAPSQTSSSPSAPVSTGERIDRRVRMTMARRRISERMKESQNTYALLTTFNEVDMHNIMNIRKEHQEQFLEKHGVKLGFMSAFSKAAAVALMDNPVVNAVIDGDEIVYRDYVDISIAVSTEKNLFVPVIRNVEKLSFADIEKQILDYATRAREGKITVEDMAGGTFTISNGGVFGSLMGTPIVNPPQSAILGLHAIQKRPVVVNDKIEIRPMMYIALTYDHRLIDGRDAVLTLRRIKDLVENPVKLLLD